MAESTAKKTVPIVFLTDNKYALPTGVAIQSLIDHWAGVRPIRIYVIVHQVCADYCARLKRFQSDDVTLELLDPEFDNDTLERYYDEGSYVSATSMLKFCIPRLLPDDDTILYLDGDILIQKDISPMTALDVTGYYAAAVEDIAAVESAKLHEMVGVKRYFNSGVILLNAKRFREESLEETMFAIGKAHPEYKCTDQSVFNKGFEEDVLWLSPKWNLMTFNLIQNQYTMAQINAFYGTTYRDIHNMERQAVLIHLTNEFKPWKYRDVYRSREWKRVFRRTPFSDVPLSLIRVVNTQIVLIDNVPQQQISVRYGPIVKEWTGTKTVVMLFQIPIATKTKLPALHEIRILGIPLIRKEYNSELVTTRVLGVPIRKQANHESNANRFEQ